jgi:hypothetical protein
LSAPLLILFCGSVVALAATGLSSSAIQTNGNLQITQFHHVQITGDDIRNLPSGDHRIVQKVVDADNSTGKPPTGKVTFYIDGVNQNTSTELTKVGTGTLILPNANNSLGVTKVGPGELQNSSQNSSVRGGITKLGSRRLILHGDGAIVYEFLNVGPLEFGQVVVPTADRPTESVSFPFGTIKTQVQKQRPSGAMRGWPFKRLIIGPAQGIAQVEGWQPSLSSVPAPASKFVCTAGSFCSCIGTLDCLSLVDSGRCSSNMNCDGSGSGVKCFCNTK